MKRAFLALLFVLQASLAWAGCSVGALPFQLQNNTTADATQVMADFNQITTGVGTNCAAAGANNDITSLGALSTPLSPSQGGTPVFAGGFTSGSTNAQTLAVPSNFTLTTGYHISGLFSLTNTAAMTISVNGGAAQAVYRKQQFGISSTAGGEAIAGHPFEMVYNGTQWIMLGETIMVGEMRTMSGGVTAPPGWLIADGSTFVCTTFADLCNLISTTYGGTSSNPALPDTRGRVMTGLDNYGTSPGAANRLTNAATGCGTTFSLGVSCANASQSHTQIVAELAQHNHTDSGHTHVTSFGTSAVWSNGVNNAVSTANGGSNTSVTSATGNAVITNTGSSQAMPIVPNNLGQIMIIRF